MKYNKYNLGTADLHTHTNASDGLLRPDELVLYAKQKGLDAIAITDHDTTDSIVEAIKKGQELDIEVIPGIELNTQHNEEEVHVLGYFLDINNIKLQNTLSNLRHSRVSRAKSIIENLTSLYGFDITYEEVIENVEANNITRPHIGRVLIKKRLVNNMTDAFEKYLGSNCPAYVERDKLTPEEGICLINNAGGVAVLAHPGLLSEQSLINNHLFKLNFIGIEVYHSKHSMEQVNYLTRIAIENHLIATGGSDCHGELINGHPLIGDVTVDLNIVNALKSKCSKPFLNRFIID